MMKRSMLSVAVIMPISLGWLPLLTAPVYAQASHSQTSDARTPVDQSPFVGHVTRNPIGSIEALQETDTKCMDAVHRGEALMKAGDLNAAISAFQEGLSYNPKNGLAYQRLAEAQTANGNLQGAAATYRTLLYWWPGKDWSNIQISNSCVQMRFSLVLLHLGQRAEALKAYQQGIHHLPTDRGPLPPLFTSPDFADADFTAAAYTAKGLYEMQGGDADPAADFTRAIATQPNLATPYYYLGEILKFKNGRAADAVTAFQKAEQLGGPEMKPFVEKASKDGISEFTAAARKAGLAAQ